MAMTPAERQRLHRARKRHGYVDVTGVVTDRDTGKPSLAVTRVAKNLAAGMSDRQALREAGSSENAAGLLDKARAALAQTLIEKGGHWPVLVEHAVKSLGRKKPMQVGLTSIEVDDALDQREARRDLWEWNEQAGEVPQTVAHSAGPGGLHYHLHLESLRGMDTPDVVVVSDEHQRQLDDDA